MNFLALCLFLTFSTDSIKALLRRDFNTSFTEIVVYKEEAIRDTFKGTLTKKKNVITMRIEYPFKETYTIKNDTLFIESGGKTTKEQLSDESFKFLRFEFLDDTLRYRIEIKDNIITLYPKENDNFNLIRLTIENNIPKKLEIDDELKNITFHFFRWKFLAP